jgi:hypothetical protein
MQSISLSAQVDRNNLIADDPLARTRAAGLEATVLCQLIYIEHQIGFYGFASPVFRLPDPKPPIFSKSLRADYIFSAQKMTAREMQLPSALGAVSRSRANEGEQPG